MISLDIKWLNIYEGFSVFYGQGWEIPDVFRLILLKHSEANLPIEKVWIGIFLNFIFSS